MVSARRFMMTAESTIRVMISARSVPTRDPVATSYKTEPAMATAAAHFLIG